MRSMPEPATVVQTNVGRVDGAGEILVPFSQVYRVVSHAIGSRFWQLQKGDSCDDEDVILAEVANESNNVTRLAETTGAIPKSSRGNGVQSLSSSDFRRSLQVDGRGDYGQGSSSKTSKDQLFDDAIVAGYSPAELRKVGISPGRNVQGDDIFLK